MGVEDGPDWFYSYEMGEYYVIDSEMGEYYAIYNEENIDVLVIYIDV